MSHDRPEALLRVVRGDPDAAELAAVVAVVSTRSERAPEPRRPLSVWAARSRMVRPQLRPAPGAWRASSWPR